MFRKYLLSEFNWLHSEQFDSYEGLPASGNSDVLLSTYNISNEVEKSHVFTPRFEKGKLSHKLGRR